MTVQVLIPLTMEYAYLRVGMFLTTNRLVGLVVKAFASRAEDPRLESRLRRDFAQSSHTNYFKLGTPVAILPAAWSYRISAGTGRPGVSIL